MKKNLLSLFTFLIPLMAICQHQADNWFFGVFAGLNFTSGVPVAISSNNTLNTNEGCSAISDSAGNLLFYTDGVTVWNRQHHVMPNGTGLMGGISCTQSALVVPLPSSTTLFYLFTLDETGGPNGFRYSIVDMTLDSSRGDIVTLNTPVQTSVTERQTAIKNNLTNSYWITVHAWGSDAFYTYLLDSASFHTTPVISHTGIVHNTSIIQNTYGQMKFSPCGDRIAVAAGYLDTVQVFDFNSNTGVISNAITLPMTNHVYGLEFSGDGKKLYVSCYDPSQTLVQFDLTSGNAATIRASQTALSQTPDIYGLQRASDNKVYVCKSFNQYLGVVNYPDIAGVSCNYVDSGVNLDPNSLGVTSALGLPGFPQSVVNSGEAGCFITTSVSNAIDNGRAAADIFPNPSSSTFNIHFPANPSSNTIIIRDVMGKTVEQYSQPPSSDLFTFGKNLSAGIYIVSFINQTGINNSLIIKTE
jgi:hypothetical protein